MMEPSADIVLTTGGNENESAPPDNRWLHGICCRLFYRPVFQLHHLKGAGRAPDPAKEPARHPTSKVISSFRGRDPLPLGVKSRGPGLAPVSVVFPEYIHIKNG